MRRLTSFSALVLGITGCASQSPGAWAPGMALLSASAPRTPMPAGRPVRAEATATLRTKGRTLRFDAILTADSTQGRLEAFGPFGIPLATVVWTDSSWITWLPSQEILLKGIGDSLSLPVLGLRSFRPREFAGAWIGRPLPIRAGVPVRTLGSDRNTVGLMPVMAAPTWSATLDRHTGLPLALQVLRRGAEVERIRFAAWKPRAGSMIPDSLVRTTGRGDDLRFVLRSWTALASYPAGPALSLPHPVDTILVERDGASRVRYRVRPSLAPEALSDTLLEGSMDGEEPGMPDSLGVDEGSPDSIDGEGGTDSGEFPE